MKRPVIEILSNRKFVKLFWSRVDKTSGCWVWTGRGLLSGYGHIGINYQKWLTHRLSWAMYHREHPGKMFVLHRCDNPVCVRPSHLFLGTQRDNVRDMWRKGRGSVGERNGRCKLTDRQVTEIRRLYNGRGSATWLARRYRVSEATISRICRGLSR